jgi:hypothetical protein
VTTFAVNPGPLAHAYDLSCQHLDTIGAADALWRQSIDIWADDPDTRRVIANRLGGSAPSMPRRRSCRAFAAAIRAQG